MRIISKVVPKQGFENLRKSRKTRNFKVKIELNDGNIIEASVFSVFSDIGEERHACISTQAGCRFGCKFCISGTSGFKRNLTKTEILEQIALLAGEEPSHNIDYIVYMGIGEPLDNFQNVVNSILELQQDGCYNNNIGLATCGIADKLVQLANVPAQIDMLWISLNATNNRKRGLIMPINNIFSIELIVNAAEEYALRTTSHIWFNYLLYKGFNDTFEDIKELVNILNRQERFGLMITIPSHNLLEYKKADLAEAITFLSKFRGFELDNLVSIFSPLGGGIGAKCGEFIFVPSTGCSEQRES